MGWRLWRSSLSNGRYLKGYLNNRTPFAATLVYISTRTLHYSGHVYPCQLSLHVAAAHTPIPETVVTPLNPHSGLVIVCHVSNVPLEEAQKLEMIRYLRNVQQEDGGWGL